MNGTSIPNNVNNIVNHNNNNNMNNMNNNNGNQQQQQQMQLQQNNMNNNNNNNNNGGSSPSIQPVDDAEEKRFISNLFYFMTQRGTPIEKIPIFDHKELNLYKLYNCVISRGGLEAVIENKLWRQITTDLAVDPERTDAGFRLRIHYLKYLYPYERKHYLKIEDDEQFDYEAFEKHLSKSPADKKTSLSRKKKQQLQNHYNHPSNQLPVNHHQNLHQHIPHTQIHTPTPNNMNNNSNNNNSSINSGKTTPSPTSSPGALLSSPSSSPHNRQSSSHHQPQHHPHHVLSPQQQQQQSSSFINNSILNSNSSIPSPLPSHITSISNLNNINNNNNSNNNNINIINNNNNSLESFSNDSILSLYSPSNFSTPLNNSSPAVNLKLLEIKSLKKYNAYHRLKVSHSPSRTELVSAVIQHFSHQNIDEDTIISSFLKRVKSESRRQLEKV